MRISFDYLGVIDFADITVQTEVLRPGRAVELVQTTLHQHDRPVHVTRVWRIAQTDTREVEGGLLPVFAPVDDAGHFDMGHTWPGAYVESIEVRAVGEPAAGATRAWMTTRLEVVDGEPITDLCRLALLADTANGIATRTSPDDWQFPNVDLTIHLAREPSGQWIGFDTTVVYGPTGAGLTATTLFDERGQVGRAEQALLVRPR